MNNDNGRTYEVLEVVEYNAVDKEYYKNSWQKKALALVTSSPENFAVVRHLGETSWGSGTYYSHKKDAVEDYTERVKKYLLLLKFWYIINLSSEMSP